MRKNPDYGRCHRLDDSFHQIRIHQRTIMIQRFVEARCESRAQKARRAECQHTAAPRRAGPRQYARARARARAAPATRGPARPEPQQLGTNGQSTGRTESRARVPAQGAAAHVTETSHRHGDASPEQVPGTALRSRCAALTRIRYPPEGAHGREPEV